MKTVRRGFNNSLCWLAMAFMLGSLISCSSNLENAIVGKWRSINGKETMELFKDGTITLADKGMGMGGKYKFVDKDRIKVEMGGLAALGGPFVVTVSISGDELTWTMPDGEASRFKRE